MILSLIPRIALSLITMGFLTGCTASEPSRTASEATEKAVYKVTGIDAAINNYYFPEKEEGTTIVPRDPSLTICPLDLPEETAQEK